MPMREEMRIILFAPAWNDKKKYIPSRLCDVVIVEFNMLNRVGEKLVEHVFVATFKYVSGEVVYVSPGNRPESDISDELKERMREVATQKFKEMAAR